MNLSRLWNCLSKHAVCLLFGVMTCGVDAHEYEYTAPFVEGTVYAANVPHPNDVLGYPTGSKPATYEETIRYFETLSRSLNFVQLRPYGKTHEGRDLVYLVISSPENMKRLEEIKTNIGKLADPRKLSRTGEAETILKNTPAVAWMAYSIHGDELSSTDAAIWLAYQLAAGEDADTRKILDQTVVCIDPIQNPDGRARALDQVRMFSGQVMNPDIQSAQHTGIWPWGRGNHYFFDLNRDFFILSQPETRARVQVYREWYPQLLVDSHEMEAFNTYLFSPSREPLNNNLTPMHHKWSRMFAEDQAKAFDQHGWNYYTREWLDDWYPGYTEWYAYAGGIVILYEQARVFGGVVRRPEGTYMTYRETVHHHITSSLANLKTLASHREEILRDYFAEKEKALQPNTPGEIAAYLIEPSTNTTRERALIANLLQQGIEVQQAEESFRASAIRNPYGESRNEREFPAGSWIIGTRQPMKNLLNAVLEFDPRMKDEFLKDERYSLEKKNQSRMYDISSWSMPIAYGVKCYEATTAVTFSGKPVAEIEKPVVIEPPVAKYGYAFTGDDDASTHAVVRLLQRGAVVRVSNEAFVIQGKKFPRGSFLLRRVENKDDLCETVQAVSRETHVSFYAADTALDLNAVDLGGGHFTQLEQPKIAVLMGPSVSTISFGSIWNLLDHVYETRMTSLNADWLNRADLRSYNVLILPAGTSVAEGDLQTLKEWVEGGGTLIAVGTAVAPLTNTKTGISAVRERKDVLDQLDVYEEAVAREEQALLATASQKDIWDYDSAEIRSATESVSKKTDDPEKRKRQDAWERRFAPQGAFLRANVDPTHWLAYGVNTPLAVMVGDDSSYYAKAPVETAVRISDEASVRISGLLWPEARQRYAHTAYATRERKGKGQIILFPFEPQSRGYYPQTSRMLWNAIFLGPGLGAQAQIPW